MWEVGTENRTDLYSVNRTNVMPATAVVVAFVLRQSL